MFCTMLIPIKPMNVNNDNQYISVTLPRRAPPPPPQEDKPYPKMAPDEFMGISSPC